MVTATVSGSFHRHMLAISAAVNTLVSYGVNVLSPADPRVVDHSGDFLFVASDRLRSVKLVQMRHFEAIRASDFLWVVCPDGYTGASTSAEIGAAYMAGTPVFCESLPIDITMQEFVVKVGGIKSAVDRTSTKQAQSSYVKSVSKYSDHLTLDPRRTLTDTITSIEGLIPKLHNPNNLESGRDEIEQQFAGVRQRVSRVFGFSTKE